jgi:hypothetical protein
VDVTTETPASTQPAGRDREWRLRADSLSNKKMSDEQLEGLRHRSRIHLNTKASNGVEACVAPPRARRRVLSVLSGN